MSKVFVNTANYPIDVESGRIVPQGSTIELSLDNDHDKALVAHGVLVEVKHPTEDPDVSDVVDPPTTPKGGK